MDAKPFQKMLEIDFPIFAFSHCRDVVAAVSKAGGLGVLGASLMTGDRLEHELTQLDRALGDRPYGVDIVLPKRGGKSEDELRASIPQQHRDFVASLAERFGIPDYDSGERARPLAEDQWEVVKRHKSAKMIVGALGPLPDQIISEAHDRGMAVGGLVGKPRHAVKQVEAGTDIIIAQGTEAGGHTGELSTFVLIPQVVDAIDDAVPVLAAGGIGDGRQILAAEALGAKGVWTGSVWLTTWESDLPPKLVDKILRSEGDDTVRTKVQTGRPVRVLRTPWVAAWEGPDAPPLLEPAVQRVLVADQLKVMVEREIEEPMGTPLGQIAGMMQARKPAGDVFHELVNQYIDAVGRISEGASDLD